VLSITVDCDNCSRLLPRSIDHKRVGAALKLVGERDARFPLVAAEHKHASLSANGFAVRLGLSPLQGRASEAAKIDALCCGSSMCADALVKAVFELANAERKASMSARKIAWSCDSQWSAHSTLSAWPGDQDRLNWLFEQNQNETLVTSPGVAVCISPNGKQDMVLFHHCEDQDVKGAFMKKASVRLWKRYAADVTEQEWELARGWKTLNDTLPVFYFRATPQLLTGFSTDEALTWIDRGEFEVVNV
jgi:hypothetical protein